MNRRLTDPHVPEIVAVFSLALGLFVGSLIQMLATLDGGRIWIVVATFAATLLYAGLKVRRYLRSRP